MNCSIRIVLFLTWVALMGVLGNFPLQAVIQQPEDVLPDLPGSGILNVRDFGAKGDGVSDDLPAIKAALEKALDSNGRYSRPPFIYFPAGTYLISDSLEARIANSWSAGWRAGAMFMGEQQSKVIIQLADQAPGFQDPAKPKPVIKTGSESDQPRPDGWGNRAFRHNIFNLTVDTGKGNPGASGIDFLANNRGAVRNVTIRSGDPEGSGVTGLVMNRQWPGPGLIKHVTIEGFDTGIEMLHHGQYSMTFENITLVGQKKLGVNNKQNGVFIEGLHFKGSVPALKQSESSGLTVLIDSTIETTSQEPAIDNRGYMLVRNVEIKSQGPGLQHSLKDHSETLRSGRIDEWISHPSLGKKNAKTLGLAVKKSPEFVASNPSDWQNAAEFIVEGQDPTEAIQKALNAGKPVVYFPNGGYSVSKTLVVPPSVKRITGCQSALSANKETFKGTELFKVSGGSDPLIIEHFWFSRGTEKGEPSSNNKVVVQDSNRPLVFRHVDIHGGYENTSRGGGDVFFEDIMGTPLRVKHPQALYGRQVNCEFLHDEPMIQNRGGDIWILGYKTEGQQIILESDGGQVEILGGLAYALGKQDQKYDKLSMFRLKGTKVSLTIAGNGNEWVQIIEGDNSLTSKDAPRRGRAAMLMLFRE
ncbi:MAG: glycosyl hydrolase family 28-related protein [Candidatus Methylacidiphilales bacterium]